MGQIIEPTCDRRCRTNQFLLATFAATQYVAPKIETHAVTIREILMASKHPLLYDPLLRQISYLPWIWSKELEAEHSSLALHKLSVDPSNTEAWKVLAAMTIEDPSLHLEILFRIRRIDPDDRNIETRIRTYLSSVNIQPVHYLQALSPEKP